MSRSTLSRSTLSRSMLPAFALALSLAACAPMPVEPSPPYTGTCDATRAAWAVGKAATPETVERVRVETGSKVARVIRPNQPVTMDYSNERVNVHVNDRGAITGVTCG